MLNVMTIKDAFMPIWSLVYKEMQNDDYMQSGANQNQQSVAEYTAQVGVDIHTPFISFEYKGDNPNTEASYNYYAIVKPDQVIIGLDDIDIDGVAQLPDEKLNYYGAKCYSLEKLYQGNHASLDIIHELFNALERGDETLPLYKVSKRFERSCQTVARECIA